MAAEYEVNISLNTKTINAQLNTLEKRLSKIAKAASPLDSGSEAQKQVKNLDRIRATGVIINRLGRELNKLEAQGVKVQNERRRIKRAVAKLDKGLVETARAHVVEIRNFVKEANKGLKTKEKTVKLDNVQAKFAYRKARALARSNERNEKDLRLNQKMTADARARMRLLSQSGAQAFIKANPPAQGRQLADDIDARLKAQEKSARLANQINELEAKGVSVTKHRKQLGKIRTAQADGLFGLAAREVRVLRKSLELERSKLRILKEQSKFLAGGPMRFPSGRRVTSPFDVGPARPLTQAAPSSFVGQKQLQDIELFERKQQRAALNAHLRQLGFIQKQTKARIAANDKVFKDNQKDLADFDKSLNKAIADRQNMFSKGVAKAGVKPDSVFGPLRQLGQASMVAGANEAKLLAGRFRAPSSPLTARPVTRASADQAAKQVEKEVMRRTALDKRATDQAAAYRRRVNRQVSRAKLDLDQIEFKNQIDDIEKLAQRQIKEGEKAGREFDRELKRREKARERLQRMNRKARNRRIGDAALGAGFPLLFGGGPGSVVGGALGGALGGGLAAQIGLSAIGQQIDQFIAGVSNIGKSLTSASGTLEMFREKNLFSSDAVKEHAFELEQQGKMQELATLLTKDLASQIGKNAVESFQVLGGEVKEFLKTINHLFVAVGGFVAGPLAKLLSAINTVIGGVSTDIQFASLRDSLSGEARAQFDAIVAQERGTRKLTSQERQRAISKGESLEPRIGKLTTAVKERVLANEAIPGLRQAIDITGQTTLDDTLGFKPFKPTGPTKEEREETRLQKRLGQLAAERQAVIDVSRFKDKIAAANAAEDQQLVIRLQGEQKIAEIEGKRLKDLAGVTDQREKDAINIGAATEKLAAHRDVERELGELQRKRQEKFETTIESLDHQLALARATTEEERERLRIEEALRKLREDDKLSQPQLDAIKKRMEALAEEKNLINTFLKETREQIEKLNDPMFQAISLAQTLGNAFSESFRGIVDGSMSAQQALANLFQRTADHFLDMAAEMIAAQLRMQAVKLFMSFFSSPGVPSGFSPSSPDIGGTFGVKPETAGLDFSGAFSEKALGGAVGAGRPYMVGERGPELFVPGAQGNIVPNNAMGGSNIVVNVDASGSSVQGDGPSANQLGKAIGAAVQAELIKQKRPGGLLTR